MRIRIGTRGSKLALWQAGEVQRSFLERGIVSEIRVISTRGDQILDKPVQEIGGKGLFTKELDEALLNNEVDIAVHSAKDIPNQLEAGLEICAALKREDPRDVLVSKNEELDPENQNIPFVIGTSSVRRAAMLRHFTPAWKVAALRGNIDTRVRKMMDGEYDAIMVAHAGIKRLGITGVRVLKLNPSAFTPAPGQGIIAVVAKEGSAAGETTRESLNHGQSEIELRCERAFLKKMDAGCSVPVFALSTVVGENITLMAGFAAEDGSKIHREEATGPVSEPELLGNNTAEVIIKRSGGIRG